MVEDLIDGLKNWMDAKGFRTIEDFRGASLERVRDWKNLNLNYKIVARIDAAKCIGCELCYVACWDGAHQCIHVDREVNGGITVTPIPKLDGAVKSQRNRVPRVDEDECVGCNLCWLVCPVEGCIRMERIDSGVTAESWEQRCQRH